MKEFMQRVTSSLESIRLLVNNTFFDILFNCTFTGPYWIPSKAVLGAAHRQGTVFWVCEGVLKVYRKIVVLGNCP